MGGCFGKEATTDGRSSNPNVGAYDLAITDPDLGWRSKTRHICYPMGPWEIGGLKHLADDDIQTNMISLTIAAAHHAFRLWSRYQAISQNDVKIDVHHANTGNCIHKHFGIMSHDWRLVERNRRFRCAEVNPTGIQGASTLATIVGNDAKKSHNTTTPGSAWREGDRVQLMEHNFDPANRTSGASKKRLLLIDCSEIALNIVEFSRRIANQANGGSYLEYVNEGTNGWIIDQSAVKDNDAIKELMRENSHDDRYVYVISPQGLVFRLVPEELLMSVTSRLQQAFMTQSAF